MSEYTLEECFIAELRRGSVKLMWNRPNFSLENTIVGELGMGRGIFNFEYSRVSALPLKVID